MGEEACRFVERLIIGESIEPLDVLVGKNLCELAQTYAHEERNADPENGLGSLGSETASLGC